MKSVTRVDVLTKKQEAAMASYAQKWIEPIYRWTKDGVEYIRCDKPYIIQHVGGDEEHGVQEVEAGTRKVLHEQEYDPFKNELRIVID